MWSDCEPRPRLAVSELREHIRLLSHRLEPNWASLLGLLGTASLQGLVVGHERDPKMLQPQSPNRLAKAKSEAPRQLNRKFGSAIRNPSAVLPSDLEHRFCDTVTLRQHGEFFMDRSRTWRPLAS